jgi:hypothetical protein
MILEFFAFLMRMESREIYNTRFESELTFSGSALEIRFRGEYRKKVLSASYTITRMELEEFNGRATFVRGVLAWFEAEIDKRIKNMEEE